MRDSNPKLAGEWVAQIAWRLLMLASLILTLAGVASCFFEVQVTFVSGNKAIATAGWIGFFVQSAEQSRNTLDIPVALRPQSNVIVIPRASLDARGAFMPVVANSGIGVMVNVPFIYLALPSAVAGLWIWWRLRRFRRDAGQCPKCGYPTLGARSVVCPECGAKWCVLSDGSTSPL